MGKKIALVTGGIRGIGHAISKKLLSSGAFVIAVGTNKERCKKWVDTQKEEGFEDVDAYACDVSDCSAASEMIKSIKEKYGRIDILVNNAGITRDATFKKMTLQQWDEVMKVNVNSLYNVTQPVLGLMLDNGYGRIVNISSINGQKGQFGQANYSTAKAAVHGFTKSLALETASKNITVNTVSPGYIATDMMRDIPEEILQKIIAQIPVKRLGTPEEIADIVQYLSDEKSGFITGSNIAINGGQHMC
ncbi:acetoacetyl-CoA reductase [Lentisphaerota bacterium ZTH]|nr:acetoacetyl-CoA reductase [Lentisphaerota bacterium]WET05917.1 acetoacetyl-CoA reductase [Lentisphaerota bacterium ZTH]